MKISCRSENRLKTICWEVCRKIRIQNSEQLKTVLSLYDQDIKQKDVSQDIRGCTIPTRNRNFEARSDRTETGTLPKQRGKVDAKALNASRRICYQVNAKKASVPRTTHAATNMSKHGRGQKNERETTRSPSLASQSPRKTVGKALRKAELPE